ncbi:unnamed protein product [Leptosia nina]|uniref:Alpha-1,6-mannosyl-glycoprotein 2-beta-N-acetylglucosaminyltransferase n=1 Tax=Leptosia nina TaxID=320188 RepID=A0AAV1J304_9NEOP
MSLDTENVDIDQILRLKELVSDVNTKQKIHHKHIYIANVTLFIVIQVHDRAFYLEHLLQSLERAKGVSKCMIIFSHDYFDNDTAAIVQNTYFTKYMQIFYPYNIQMHPNVFPGQDFKFCSKSMLNCEANVKRRDADKAQLKHRWWWTVSTVFDKLKATRDYDGNFIFLEEDQYVTEDIIFIVKLAEKMLPQIFPNFDVIALGPRRPKIRDYHSNDTRLDIEPWGFNENIAVTFNRSFWNRIKKLGNYFCSFNDYSWSNSLTHISKYADEGKFLVAAVKSARVFRFEICQYSDDTYCHEVEKVIGVQKFVKKVKKYLYPPSVSYAVYDKVKPRIKILGGWEDVRDYELCMFYTSKIQTDL